MPNHPDHAGLLDLLAAGPVAVLTGAGLSTASGVPAYRDRHGQWRHAPPIRHQDFLASATVRRRYWARSFVGWPRMAQAEPNPGHHALVRLDAQAIDWDNGTRSATDLDQDNSQAWSTQYIWHDAQGRMDASSVTWDGGAVSACETAIL